MEAREGTKVNTMNRPQQLLNHKTAYSHPPSTVGIFLQTPKGSSMSTAMKITIQPRVTKYNLHKIARMF